MDLDIVISSRPDREIRKKVLTAGNYDLVPYEDSKCRVIISEVSCTNDIGDTTDLEATSRYLSTDFDGIIVIGDSDNFIDKDVELILQQMCKGELCLARLSYRNSEGQIVKHIGCKISLEDATREELVSDWNWTRLFNKSVHHKERGVELVKEKRIPDAFRRFSKALKLIVAVEPVDPELIPEEKVNEMIEFKVKLYNNLAHCQLHYDEFEAALELCNRALKYDPENVKAMYRRSVAYTGLHMYEEAWHDINAALALDPSDKAAQQKAKMLRPKIEKINTDYKNVIKKMFG